MTIIMKNKAALVFDDFEFQCCIGKKDWLKIKLKEIKKRPGIFSLGNLFIEKIDILDL